MDRLIGAVNLDHCPAKTYVPLWLVVGGACTALHQVVLLYHLINKKFLDHDEMDDDSDDGTPVLSILFNTTIICFQIAWFLAGLFFHNIKVIKALYSQLSIMPLYHG